MNSETDSGDRALDERAVLAAFNANHNPLAEPSSLELDKMRKSIRAYLAASGAVPVVKGLEWMSEPPYSVARVPALYLLYSTECVWNAGKFYYCQLSGNCLNKVFPTLEAAKAAAQSDYEARIRSALVDAPARGAAPSESEAMRALTDTGCRDKDGNPLHLGDHVLYRMEGSRIKQEYWNPEYVIVWDAPKFTLKHISGGKDDGSHDFKLKHGGPNGALELVARAAIERSKP